MTPRKPPPPKKSLGQNFLINPRVADRIIEECQLREDETVLEIGPGKGALTRVLAPKVQKFIAVEKDDQLAASLQEEFKGTDTEIVHGDILEYPFNSLPEGTKIIGNLPYNIATPIIKAVINARSRISDLYATVQLDFGRRLTARPGTKSYGSFSCFVQYFADVRLLFRIKNTSFQPVPKVQSCFLHFNFPRKPRCRAINEDLLFRIIRASFSQRRKNIRNALSAIFGKEEIGLLLQKSKIDPESRAENVSLKEFIALADRVDRDLKGTGR